MKKSVLLLFMIVGNLYSGPNEDLLQAAKNNNLFLVVQALERGADVNAKNEYGQTALHKAASNRSLEIANFLIENGACLDVLTDEGYTPLAFACQYNPDHRYSVKLVQYLIEHGADVNKGRSVLSLGILYYLNMFLPQQEKDKFHDILNYLIAKGVNVNAIDDRSGETPLFCAASGNSKPLVKLLLDHGADINHRDTEGNTPLMTAVEYVHPEMVKLLIELGANPDIVNKEGKTAMSIREDDGSDEDDGSEGHKHLMIRLLRKAPRIKSISLGEKTQEALPDIKDLKKKPILEEIQDGEDPEEKAFDVAIERFNKDLDLYFVPRLQEYYQYLIDEEHPVATPLRDFILQNSGYVPLMQTYFLSKESFDWVMKELEELSKKEPNFLYVVDREEDAVGRITEIGAGIKQCSSLDVFEEN